MRISDWSSDVCSSDLAFCTDCHGTLKDRLKDTKLGDAADFGTSHPQFSALVQTRPGKHPRFTRASLGSRPMDDGGLKFPHDIHLSADRKSTRLNSSH